MAIAARAPYRLRNRIPPPPDSMPLSLDIHHRQGAFALDATLAAGPGVLALFGASGSGKTTLIDIVAGLIRPARGHIVLDGEVLTDTAAGIHVPPHRRRIGYVFQEGRLFPHLSVRQNLVYGRWFARSRIDPAADAVRLAQVTSLLGLGSLLERAPKNLSGGEKQRVAIGRALLSEPRLLIMDEPLAALDQARKDEILPYLERLRDEAGVPMIYVSHSAPEVARLATTVAVLDAGRLAAFGPVTDVLQQSDLLPAPERGEAGAVIDAVLEAGAAGADVSSLRSAGNRWQVPRLSLPAGTRLRLHVRARDVMIATAMPVGLSALNVLPGHIVSLRPEGAHSLDVALECNGDRLLARVTRASGERLELVVGQPVHAVVKAVAFDRG